MPEQLGLIGLAVMGENLVLNLADHGVSVAVFNRTAERTRQFAAGAATGRTIRPTYSLGEFAAALERPRRAILMVKAGPAVDAMIEQLLPHLEAGDTIIDAGNSNYRDTERRAVDLTSKGLQYVGMGVSGGELGARYGPSIMPGGARAAYDLLEPVLKAIAAQVDTGPCVAYIGPRGAGHFVKMVHNGIEYGDMQLIAEAYDLLHRGAGLEPRRLAQVFGDWNRGELQSYLIEITAEIVDFPDDQGTPDVLVDRIDDRAGQKGTGKWTTEAAMELGVPVPTITAAVDARLVSAMKDERLNAAEVYDSAGATAGLSSSASYKGATGSLPASASDPAPRDFVDQVRKALYAAKICSYAQGFALLAAASRKYEYGLDLGEIARIWKGGCIIRAVFLDRVRAAFQRDPELANLLVDGDFAGEVRERLAAWRSVVRWAIAQGIPVPAFSASLAYFDSYRSARLPANLLQAQRDYFGAHTYKRTDREGTFHTEWSR